MLKTVILAMSILARVVFAAPVVITGSDLPGLVGKPVDAVRVTDLKGAAIPFQVDEITEDGEYALPSGERPIVGDGVFGARDEIVFMWDDADVLRDRSFKSGGDGGAMVVYLTRGGEKRVVRVLTDASIPLSPKRYMEYDHAAHRIVTPYYYAVFAKDRFHFTSAGVKDFDSGAFIDLTNELRVSIDLRTLFGLVPIRYTEDNIVCYVRRYKAGPVRLIRRGDFHLNLGLGVKGSRAAVNQICYPQIVEVPVYVNLPVRFRTLFSQAFIEMTPVIREEGRRFRFDVPHEGLSLQMIGGPLDALHETTPDGKLFMLRGGGLGYGWLLRTTMKAEHTGGSGFVIRRPSSSGRVGVAECGYRLTVRDVPKGSYHINNWVFFSGGKDGDIERLAGSISRPVRVETVEPIKIMEIKNDRRQ